MNKQSQRSFENVATQTLQTQRSSAHYQMRNRIILPIIHAIQAKGLPITACAKDDNTKFTISGTDKNRRVTSREILRLEIENDGTLLLQRFKPLLQGTAPTESMSVSPQQGQKKLMTLLRTLAVELSKFYDMPGVLSKIVFHHDPRGEFQKITQNDFKPILK